MPEDKTTMYTWNLDAPGASYKNTANGPPRLEPHDQSITVGYVAPAQGQQVEQTALASWSVVVNGAKRQKAKDIIGAILVDLVDQWGMTISEESRNRWINLVMEKL